MEKAMGMPEVENGMVAEYNDSNSASLSNTTSQIFCGGFKGEIPKDALQKKIVVKFSWAEKNTNSSQNEPDTNSESETIPLEGEVLSGEVEPEPEVLPAEDVPQEILPEEEDSGTELVEPEPEASEPTEPEPTILNLITKTAHAETLYLDGDVPDGRLEVFYTIDGENWQSLGFVPDVNNGVSFEMPTGIFTTVEDLEKVQIAIHTMPTFDNIHTIYLDSVWLEVEYENLNAESAKGITSFKIFVLPQDRLEKEVNEWLSLQKNIEVDDIKVEDYGGGGYLIVISYHSGGILGNSTARLKVVVGENPEADAQTFLSTLLPAQVVHSITATAGSFSSQQTTITVPIIFIVYE